MRQALLDCCGLDWSRISPAIFGSLFQSVMDPALRRNLGAHYTREENILKLIRPLFLDALRAEFERVRRNRRQLEEFHKKLASLRFLDPACGCGNFLVITYRELRLLELDILRDLYKGRESGFLDISRIVWLDVDRFYGIEIEEFPAQIAQVALWMTDHQMNLRISEEFGSYYHRLPLRTSPNILYGPEKGNALRIDWSTVVDPKDLSFILGNPPFVGKQHQSAGQKADGGNLCFVTKFKSILHIALSGGAAKREGKPLCIASSSGSVWKKRAKRPSLITRHPNRNRTP
jgi:type I restriction-modification system DNA methylase subunit